VDLLQPKSKSHLVDVPRVKSVECLGYRDVPRGRHDLSTSLPASAPRDCTSIFLPPAIRKPAHTHSFRPFAPYTFYAHSFVSIVDLIPAVCILPPSKHLAHLSRTPQLNTASSTNPPHVNHELATEEICALVRHPSRRQRFHVSKCTFAGIGEISP
jgi:hypothetical protein